MAEEATVGKIKPRRKSIGIRPRENLRMYILKFRATFPKLASTCFAETLIDSVSGSFEETFNQYTVNPLYKNIG
jgi:hypothetical protein